MKPIVTGTIGISGSGKSTFAKEQCRLNPNTIRLNRDDMRQSLFGMSLSEYFAYFHTETEDEELKESLKKQERENEVLISDLIWKAANQAIKKGNNVILDNTHLDIKYIKAILNNITEDCDFQIEWFFVDPETCIERDSLRETVIGEAVIRKQAERFNALYQKRAEIDQLIEDRKKLNFTPVVQNPKLPKAIIFDVDGTLALMNGKRGPFDWDKVGLDDVNEPVRRIAELLYNPSEDMIFSGDSINLIICTGRDGVAEDKTKIWLQDNDISYDKFYIRKAGDFRKDSIVKREFLEDIITKYHVVGVFDDRNQVVDMWRKSGITCFQVAEGDF